MNITLSQVFENAQNDLVDKITHEVILDYFTINSVSAFLFHYNEFSVEEFLNTNYFMGKAFFDISYKLSKLHTPKNIDDLLSIYIDNEEELNKYANEYIKNYGLEDKKFSHKEFITLAIENYLFSNLYLDDQRIINSIEEQFDIFIFEKINYFLSLNLHFNSLKNIDDVYNYLSNVCLSYRNDSLNDLENNLKNLSNMNY